MKQLCAVFTLLAVLAVGAQGQSYSAAREESGGRSGYSKGGVRPGQVVKQPRSGAVEKLPPKPTGVFYEMSEQGFIVIDPTAPKEAGMGQQFLSTNPFPGAPGSNRIDENSRPFGGIRLIGFEF
jgi:hypothetical protein